MPIGNVFSTPGTSHVVQYATLGDLRSAGPPQPQNPLQDYYVAITEGYDYPGDGGGAVFVWKTNNTTIGATSYFTDDGAGLVIIPDNAPNANGAWVQQVQGQWVHCATLGLTIYQIKAGLDINERINAACNAVIQFAENAAFTVPQLSYGMDLYASYPVHLYAGSSDYPSQIPSLRVLPSSSLAEYAGGIATGSNSPYTTLGGDLYEGGTIEVEGASFSSGAALFQAFANGLATNPPASGLIQVRDVYFLAYFSVFNMNSQAGRVIFERCTITGYLGIVNPDFPLDAEFIDCRFAYPSGVGIPSGGAVQGFRNVKVRNASFGSTGNSTGYFQITGTLDLDGISAGAFRAAGQNIGSGAQGTRPSVTAFTPVSGTVYQNAGLVPLTIRIPVTFSPTSTAAASLAVAIGPSSTPATVTTDSEPAGAISGTVRSIEFHVPAGYYYSLTATNATINQGVLIS